MEKIKPYIPYVVALILCVFVAFPIGSNSVILDEAYSILLVRKSVPQIIIGTAKDVHPPLYYLILKFFSLFGGESLLLYRAVTALATWLNLIVLGATLIRRRWGERVSVFYMLWFGLTYSTLERSSVVRMYSWAAFFVTAAGLFLFFYYEDRSKKNLAMGIVMTLGAMYAHYYALLAVFLIWALLLIVSFFQKKRIAGIIIGGVIVTAGYLPWLGVLLTQFRDVAEDYWISGFDWGEWRMVPAYLMEASDSPLSGIGAVLYALILLALLAALLRKRWDALCCAGIFFGTMVLAAVISVAVTSIWMTRYMYVAWGMIALFMAVTAGEVVSVYSNLVQGMLLLVLLIAGLHSFHTMMADETMNSTADEWVAFLRENVEADAYVIFDDPWEHKLVYEYYLPEATVTGTPKLRKDALSDFLAESQGRELWYIIDYRQQILGSDAMRDALEKLGYTMETRGSFIIKQKSLEVFRVEKAG